MKNIVLIGIAVFCLAACGKNNRKYDASGVFETTEIVVSSEAAGKILQFNVEEGQTLESGQVIGYVDTVQLYLKKLQLSANIKAVKNRQTNVPKQIAALREQIAKQKIEQNRFENLVKSNAANQKQLDDIQAQLIVFEKQLAAQVETLDNANKIAYEESVALEIQIAQLDDQIRKSIITSPIRGTVLSKYSEPGEITGTGKALFKIADINKMFLRAYITSAQLSQLKIGQTVKIFTDFGKGERKEYEGVVTWISDKSEFTPKSIQTKDERDNLVYAIKIAVVNDGFLKVGMYGEIKLSIK